MFRLTLITIALLNSIECKQLNRDLLLDLIGTENNYIDLNSRQIDSIDLNTLLLI